MVGFGSSLRMSRRRGWEDAYLDYASLRLLLTQIEAVYEEEDWKARDSANAAASAVNGSLTDSGGLFNEGLYYDNDGRHDDDDDMENAVVEDAQTEDMVLTNTYLSNVFQSAWEKTRSVVTGQPILSTPRRVGGTGHRYNKRRRGRRQPKQRIAARRQQKGSEYFEYSPETRGRLARRQRHRHRNAGRNDDDDRHHSKSRGNNDTPNSVVRGGDVENNQDDDDDDDYNDYYNDRALDKGGWRDPGVLDYRDELFMESDDDLAFGYYEEEENEETEEEDEEEEGEWIDEDEEGNENVYQYSHGDDDNYYAAAEGFGPSHHTNYIADNNNGFMLGGGTDDDGFMLERHSSDDNSDIRAELAGTTTTTSEAISPHRLGRIDDGSINNINNSNNMNNSGMRTPKRTQRHSFTSDPINNSNLLDTPERIVEFSESPGVLEAGYETFAAAAARRGDMGDANAMYVGSPPEQGWFDFLPNLWGDKSKQQQRGESRPLLFNNEEESEEDPNYFDSRHIGEDSPAAEDDVNHHDDSSLGDSTHRYTSLRSKASPTPYLPAPRPRSLSHSHSTQGNDVQDEFESRFTNYGSSAFVEPLRSTSAPPLSPQPPPTRFRSSPVMATAIGASMPMTPTTPPTPAFAKHKYVDESVEKGIVGFGVPIQMIPTEAVELLRPNSPRKSPTQSNFGSSQFYSFQNDNDTEGGGNDGGSIESEGGDYYKSDSGFYSGGGRGGETYSLRSPPNRYSSRQQVHHPTTTHPSLLSNAQTQHQFLSENPIMNLLLGRSAADWQHGGRTAVKTAGKKKKGKVGVRGRGHLPTSRTSENSNSLPSYIRPSARQSRAAAAAKSKRARLRRKRRLRQQRREERVPHHLRAAHVRAAAITERFRGLLRAEVEKVILFANSRLGELSDTIGCLRYSSYEDGQDDRNAHPNLADGGIHQLSSSDEEEDGGGHHHASDASSSSDGDAQNLDITIEHDAATRRQIIARDRLRMMRPLFQKADFLGEDFSLLSAVDEADAYAAVGVELMHLLKFVCVNIIAVRKICRKHDRLLSNRMVGGYYKKLAAEAKKSQSQRGYHHQFHWNEPQSGGTLSNPADAAITGGYIYGIYDTKIQHIANSTIMQTVSSSLSIALADFEASQSRSARLGLGFQPAKEFTINSSTPRQKSSSQSHGGVLGYQLGGHSFGGDDDSSVEENEDENGSASSNIALTRLQFVVTSIFGLREAARIKVEPFEHYASRLFMISTGPNVVGDGLDGCSRETLDLLCSYNPDAAYTLDSETLYASLKIGRENVGVGSVMIASLAAATKGNNIISNNERCRRKLSAALCIKPQPDGEGDIAQSMSQAINRNILTLNTASMVLYLINYYCVVPIAHIHSTQLGSVSSSAVLIGAANITAILSSSIHAFITSKRKSFAKKNLDVLFFRTPLILSAVFPLIGNILYSMSVKRMSLKMAVIGRLLVGLGSAEVLNRRLLSTVMPKESVNVEVARLAKKSMLAVSAGLLIGAVVDVQIRKHPEHNSYGISNFDAMNMPNIYAQSMKPTASIFPTSNSSIVSQSIEVNGTKNDALTYTTLPLTQNKRTQQPSLPFYPLNPLLPFGYRRLISIESVGIIMACLWFFQFVALLCSFDVPGREDELDKNVNKSFENVNKSDLALEEDFDSDSAGSENPKLSRHNSKPSFDSTGTNPFVSEGYLEEEEIGTHGTFEKLQVMSRKTVKTSYKGSYFQSIVYVSKLAMTNVALPTTLSLLFLAKAVNEVLLSSCASIMNHYFGASGAKSGLFMGITAGCILPINQSFASEKNFTERSIIKNALLIGRYGIICMVNYEALFYTMKQVVFRSANRDHSSSYDGFLGAAQYIFGFAIVFMSMISLESVTLTLISKVSPMPLRKYTLDGSFVAIFVSALGRIAGDIVVWASELSSWLFFNSTINTLCFFLLIGLILGSFVVKKQYFFLI